MAAIGALTINAWRGTVLLAQSQVDVFTRPGVDGTGIIVGATHGTPYQVETDHYGTLLEVTTWVDLALSYVGSVVSVTDSFGTVHADTAVIAVSFGIRAVRGLGASTHLVTANWSMITEP